VRLARPLLAASGVLLAVARDDGMVTTYGAASPALAAAGMLAGAALLAAGLIGPHGALTACAAIAWWATDLIGWDQGPSMARSVAAVIAPFLGAIILQIAAAHPRALPPDRGGRALVTVAYGATAIVSLGRAAFRDPFEVVECWSNCTDNDLLVHADRDVAAVLDGALVVTVAVIGLATSVVAAKRLRRSRARWPVLLPCALVGAGAVAYAAALAIERAEDPRRAGFAAIHFAQGTALFLLGAGLTWAAAGAMRRRAALARLGTTLGATPGPGGLAAALTSSLRDPRLEVAYWLAGEGRLVDAHGHPFELPGPDAHRAMTRVTRRDEPIAVVIHDPALLDGPELEHEIGAAARLAVDNERLQATLLARVADLRASRARIVEHADAQRRRLERDLHDGLQQRLLAVLFELRLGSAAAAGEPSVERCLLAAGKRAHDALAELRELAHGIFPTVLAESGLGHALATLADTAPIPLEVDDRTERRHGDAVETTAYLIAERAVAGAAGRGATYVQLTIEDGGGRLRLEIHDDAQTPPDDLQHIGDRAGALAGRIDAAPGLLRVELPCA
jgi:signal transduction histidine kinase